MKFSYRKKNLLIHKCSKQLGYSKCLLVPERVQTDLRSFCSKVRSFQSMVRSFHKIVSSFHKKVSLFHMLYLFSKCVNVIRVQSSDRNIDESIFRTIYIIVRS